MKKKGFTLVELLAVIVILAIIALIATPIILNVIGDAKKGAAIQSLNGYIDAAEKAIAMNQLEEDSTFPTSDASGCYELKNLDKFIKVKGTKPKLGTDAKICFKNGDVKSIDELEIDGYEMKYEDEKYYINGEEYPVEDNGNGGTSGGESSLTYYYAFGTPTTSSTTDYTTIGKNVFAALGSDDSHGVCINDRGLFCLKTNEYENSVAALKAHFGESSCTDNGSRVGCTSGAFDCNANSDGTVACLDFSTGENCYAFADGSFDCY